MLGRKLAIDLTPGLVRYQARGDSNFGAEPAAVARDPQTGTVLAVGARALQNPFPSLSYPVGQEAQGDLSLLAALVSRVAARGLGRQWFFRPDVIVVVDAGTPGRQREAILDALASLDAHSMFLMDRPVAAAIGAGRHVSGSDGGLVAVVEPHGVEMGLVALDGLMWASSVTWAHGMAAVPSTVSRDDSTAALSARLASAGEAFLEAGTFAPVADAAAVEIYTQVCDMVVEGLRAQRRGTRSLPVVLCGALAAVPAVARVIGARAGVQVTVPPLPAAAALRGALAMLSARETSRTELQYLR